MFRPSEKFFIFESGCGTVSNFLENIHPWIFLNKILLSSHNFDWRMLFRMVKSLPRILKVQNFGFEFHYLLWSLCILGIRKSAIFLDILSYFHDFFFYNFSSFLSFSVAATQIAMEPCTPYCPGVSGFPDLECTRCQSLFHSQCVGINESLLSRIRSTFKCRVSIISSQCLSTTY